METAIQLQRKGKAEYYAVLIKLYRRNEWVFVRCFQSLARAEKFLDELEEQIMKGNYECLTLKT